MGGQIRCGRHGAHPSRHCLLRLEVGVILGCASADGRDSGSLMRKFFAALVLVLAGCSMSADTKLAQAAVVTFHEMLDAGQFEAIYDGAAADLKGVATKEKFVELLQAVHKKLGNTRASDMKGWNTNYSTSGSFVTLTYQTFYTDDEAKEQFVYRLLGDKALLAGYHVESNAFITK